MTAVLAVLALLAIAVFVAAPLADRGRLDASVSAALLAHERRNRALAALRELELDHRTGKLTDDDYQSLLAVLRREAAEALAETS